MSIFQKQLDLTDVKKLQAKQDTKGLVNAYSRQKEAAVRAAIAQALGELGGPVEPGLIAALADPDLSVRQAAVAAVGKINAIGAASALAEVAQHDPNSGLRKSAVMTLDKINAITAAPILAVIAQADTDPGVRVSAVNTLGKFKTADTLPTLIRALNQDADSFVRLTAAELLGKIGDARAVEPLSHALEDDDRGVQQSAIEALLLIDRQRASEILSQNVNTRSLTCLASILAKGGNSQSAAAAILSQAGEPAAAVLAQQLQGYLMPEQESRIVAALIQIGRPAVEPLIKALQSGNERARTPALKVLQQIGDERAIPCLVAMLESEAATDDVAYLEVAQTLHALHWNPGHSPVRGRYAAVTHDWELCLSLGLICVPPLVSLLYEPREQVILEWYKGIRRRAMETLIAFGPPAVPELLKLLNYGDHTPYVAEVLGEIGDPQAIEPLRVVLISDHHTSAVRRPAAIALGKIGGSRALEILTSAAQSADMHIRSAAADGLRARGSS